MLSDAFDEGLRLGVSHAYRFSNKPTEPELVAGVFAAGLSHTDHMVASSGTRVGGVFCHQRPYVHKPADPKWKCELADLLIVSTTTGSQEPHRRALLLQVKRGVPDYATSGVPHRQVELYESWPDIEAFGSLRVLGPGDCAGAEFSFWDTCVNAIAGPVKCRACHFEEGRPADRNWSAELADVLEEMVRGTRGKEFCAEQAVTPTDHWSGLIWDLINRSVGVAWSVAASNQMGKSRAWNQGVFLASAVGVPEILRDASSGQVASELWSSRNTAPPIEEPPINPDLTDPSDGGLPIIFIESQIATDREG